MLSYLHSMALKASDAVYTLLLLLSHEGTVDFFDVSDLITICEGKRTIDNLERSNDLYTFMYSLHDAYIRETNRCNPGCLDLSNPWPDYQVTYFHDAANGTRERLSPYEDDVVGFLRRVNLIEVKHLGPRVIEVFVSDEKIAELNGPFTEFKTLMYALENIYTEKVNGGVPPERFNWEEPWPGYYLRYFSVGSAGKTKEVYPDEYDDVLEFLCTVNKIECHPVADGGADASDIIEVVLVLNENVLKIWDLKRSTYNSEDIVFFMLDMEKLYFEKVLGEVNEPKLCFNYRDPWPGYILNYYHVSPDGTMNEINPYTEFLWFLGCGNRIEARPLAGGGEVAE